jgi:broad specificity phosphatase PhoE
MPDRRIVLIRHGPSSHVHRGAMNAAQFVQWREAYEAAGLNPHETAPSELQQLAAIAGALVASDARRAIESAKLLAPDREWTVSAQLRELDLPPPQLGFVRLPLIAWALAFGMRMLVRMIRRRPQIAPHETERVRSAVQWLSELADQHGTVVVVTHASFRGELGRELKRRGWRAGAPRGRARHWSAWLYTRAEVNSNA